MNRLILAAISLGIMPFAAQGADPLAVKFVQVSNDTALATVHFVLDGNEKCDTKDGKACVFSSDCSQPLRDICVSSSVEIGTHKVEAFAGEQHLVAWVDVKNVAPGVTTGGVGECSLQEQDGTLQLICF